jgi:chromosome segregation ATPase
MASAAEIHLAVQGSSTELQSLEDKVYRTIELLKEARSQKASAELELASLRESLEAQAGESEALRQQLQALQQERVEVRTRVERLLADVDAILQE